MSLSLGNLIVILAIVILLFGAKRIPEVARALGRAMREFKKARDDLEREVDAPATDAVATTESEDRAKVHDDAGKSDAG